MIYLCAVKIIHFFIRTCPGVGVHNTFMHMCMFCDVQVVQRCDPRALARSRLNQPHTTWINRPLLPPNWRLWMTCTRSALTSVSSSSSGMIALRNRYRNVNLASTHNSLSYVRLLSSATSADSASNNLRVLHDLSIKPFVLKVLRTSIRSII